MPKTASDPPINLDGKLKLGVWTLVAIAGGIFTLAGVYGRLPSIHDLEKAFDSHNRSADSHPATTRMLSELKTGTVLVEARIHTLESRQQETHADVEYIRSRIDYLTEQTVRQDAQARAGASQPGPRAVRAGNTAVELLQRGAPPMDAVRGSLNPP